MYIYEIFIILHLLVLVQIDAEVDDVKSTSEVPFMVRVRDGLKVCAGNYFKLNWIITAAECFSHHYPLNDHKPKSKIELCMGSVNLNDCPASNKRFADGLYPFTDKEDYLKNDILLIYIERHWLLGPMIQLAEIPKEKVDKKKFYNKKCLVYGWGFSGRGGYFLTLKNAIVKLIEGGSDSQIVTEVQKTVQDPDDPEPAINWAGDPGGPLVCDDMLIGELRFGSPDGQATYTLIPNYMDWLEKVADSPI